MAASTLDISNSGESHSAFFSDCFRTIKRNIVGFVADLSANTVTALHVRFIDALTIP